MSPTRRGPAVAVVTSRSVLALAWEAALPECTAMAPSVAPDSLTPFGVVVLDVNGLGEVAHLLPLPDARVVWVHAGIDPSQLRRARRAGVDEVVHRELGLQGVRSALAAGRESPHISRMGDELRGVTGDELSLEEVMVLRLLSRGATVAQVRRETGFSTSRVERCRQGALRKLGVHTTGQGLMRAAELGLITPIGSSASG